MGERPTARLDVALESGYHSPQLDVDVRLNTNESPFPPPPGFVEAVVEAARGIDWNRYPDRSATRLRAALAERYGVTPGQVFAANGSNEVLQSLLLAYGGADRSVAVFEPTYAMYSQIARTTGTRLVKGRRATDFSLDSVSARRLVLDERPDVVILCSPNNPTGTPATDGLVADLVARATERIEQAVTDGRLDRDRADEILARVEERITARLNGGQPTGPAGS